MFRQPSATSWFWSFLLKPWPSTRPRTIKRGRSLTYTRQLLGKGVGGSRLSAGGDTPTKGIACPAASEPPLGCRCRRPRRRADRDTRTPPHPPARLHLSDTPRLGRTPTPNGAAHYQICPGPHWHSSSASWCAPKKAARVTKEGKTAMFGRKEWVAAPAPPVMLLDDCVACHARWCSANTASTRDGVR